MKVSIHPNIKGKPIQTNEGYFVGDKRVNLGYGWMNIDVDWDDLFELITTDGYATSSELNSDNRKDENFVSRQLVMVDVDEGMTIQELFVDDFYNEFGAGFYTTARHTMEQHRFRIMFVTQEPITDNTMLKKLIRALLVVYKSGDISCKDATRLYYGVENCKIKENRGKILPMKVVNSLIEMIDEIDLTESKPIIQSFCERNQTVDEIFIDQLLSRIQSKVGNLHGDYEVWRTIAWATCHSIGISTAQQLMMKYWPTKTKKELQTLKCWKSSHNGPTLGTLIKLSGISKDEKQLMELESKLRRIK